MLMALSTILHESITYKDGAVEQSNFDDYHLLRIDDTPELIDINLIPSTEHPSGVGEAALPFMGGAVSNALFALTGKRFRHMPFTRKAADAAGLGSGPVEVAELQAAFTSEEILLRRALGLGDDVSVNPSGGALASNPIMATGLARIGYAANHVFDGGKRALAHSTSGPCLQQNLICILEDGS
jgi:hypothetical protein